MHGTTPARSHAAARPARLLWCAVVVIVAACLSASSPALAAKWRHCPSQLHYWGSHIGAMSAPFAHPGHEVGSLLSSQEVATSGGFSTEPNGNTVTITLESLFGAPIVMPSFSVAAVSPETLYFVFPDTRAVLGRVLAGPV